MSRHRLSLAAGVLADFDAPEVARAAVASGFANVGFTVKPWADSTTRELERIVRDGDVRVLDVEVVIIGEDGGVSDDGRHIVDVGGALGAENVLVISRCEDPSRTAEALVALAEQAAAYGMRACLEFMRFTKVPTLAAALDVIERAGHDNVGLLIDTLHIARTGEADQIAEVPRGLLTYAQYCDGLASCADDDASLIRDALDDRSAPGEGALPLETMIGALPDNLPLSLEVRSKDLRDRFPDAADRASYLLAATRRHLQQLGRDHD